jgi:DNA-binding response OmpR family regulator
MDIIHNNDMPAFDRSIDVQVARLRKKIEPDPKEPRFIKTIRNQGYIFAAPVSVAG